MGVQLPTRQGSKQLNLKNSFKLIMSVFQTACSEEEFLKAFPMFYPKEQEKLHSFFYQVLETVKVNIEDEFESLCLTEQVGSVLDTVDQHVDEKSMDFLSSELKNIEDLKSDLSTRKEDAIRYLKLRVRDAEEKVQLMRDRLEHLKESRSKRAGLPDPALKFKTLLLKG